MTSSITPGNQVEEGILEIRNKHPEAKQVVIFAPTLSWNGEMFQRPQQLARALARRGALVFYLQPERVWPPVFTEIEERLVLCQSPSDAFHVLPDAFVYVLTWNIPLLAYFPSSRVIYDYLDDISTFTGDAQRLRRDHGDYLLKADIVMATAERLYKDATALRSDSLFVPNGVDYAHFSQPPESEPPADLKPILDMKKPIIGYHGALARWFDYDLMKTIAQKRPDLSFVLIGIDHDQTLHGSSLLQEPNVHWLGAKPYSELPRYISHFEVGCIPFVVNDVTNSTSPIKLFEYFAAGKPIIVSPMQESMRYRQALVAGNLDEWSEQIDQALLVSKDVQARKQLHEIGLQNAWEKRADELLARMEDVSRQPRKLPWYMRFELKNQRLQKLFRLIGRGFKVLRMSGFRGFIKGVYYKFYDVFARFRRSSLFRIPYQLDDNYVMEDNSQVTLFTDQDNLFPEYWPRQQLTRDKTPIRSNVTVIAACKNESDNAAQWIARLVEQTFKPTEVLIVDTGSTDQTVEILEASAREQDIPIKVFKKPGVNIATARNFAIEAAQSPVIVSLDFGCLPRLDWLEKLTQPFWLDPKMDVAASWFRGVDAKGNESYFSGVGWQKLKDVSIQEYIPASRSLAFTKSAWEKAGRYPEWLTLTGEDTYFALELKRFCVHWAFVPDAVVDWRAPQTWMQFWRKAFYWSNGDGETGYQAWIYRLLLKRYVLGFLSGLLGLLILLWLGINYTFLIGGGFIAFALVATLLWSLIKWKNPFFAFGLFGFRLAQVAGFLSGANRKKEAITRKVKDAKGLFFILAGVPIDDTGGGARCTQIALELLRQGYWVVYVNRYPKWEAQTVSIKIAHPNLFLYELAHFYWDDFAKEYEALLVSLPKFALVELPSADFLPLINKIKQNGGRVIYEMIDDWNTSLGGSWYSKEIEQQIIDSSQMLIGTAPVLQEKLSEMSHRDVELLPNAVNSRLFNPERVYRKPADLPRAEWVAAYIGALWGDWFDWDLLVSLGHKYPQASITVIGDYRGQCPDPPANLKFLGLKPQSALPAYLANIDVAIIPWKVNEITQATSPLKLYEYLAMRRPVVTPNLEPLAGIPGVFRAADQDDFVRLVNDVRKSRLPIEEMDAFVNNNNWQSRVKSLLEHLKENAPG
jgi:glycosyltransferase involved in cell wall biosynthesis